MALPTQPHSAPLEPGSPLQPLTRLPWETAVVTKSIRGITRKGRALSGGSADRQAPFAEGPLESVPGSLTHTSFRSSWAAAAAAAMQGEGRLLPKHFHTPGKAEAPPPPNIRSGLEGHLPLLQRLSALAAHLEPLGCF